MHESSRISELLRTELELAVWATNLVLEVYSAVVLAFWMEDTPMRVSTFTHSLVSLHCTSTKIPIAVLMVQLSLRSKL